MTTIIRDVMGNWKSTIHYSWPYGFFHYDDPLPMRVRQYLHEKECIGLVTEVWLYQRTIGVLEKGIIHFGVIMPKYKIWERIVRPGVEALAGIYDVHPLGDAHMEFNIREKDVVQKV